MATRYDILPQAQRSLLPALVPLKDLGFVLYGGTAIALRLGHRASRDFEFIADRLPDRATLAAAAPILADATTRGDEPDRWTVEMRTGGPAPEAVRVSFSIASGRVGTPERDEDEHLLLASPDDLFGHKLDALLRRVDTNDLRDIAALLEAGLTLERGLGAAETLFSNMPLSEAVKALVYFEAEALEELAAAERVILVNAVARFTAVADMPLLSSGLDDVTPDASLDSPRSTIPGAKST